MLKREENPELFDIVVKSINNARLEFFKTSSAIKYTPPDFSQGIDDGLLNGITELDLSAYLYSHPLKSLNGIEKLRNLEVVNLSGLSDADFITNYELTFGKQREEYQKDPRKFFNVGQIADITPLYQCKSLRELNLNDQRKIKELDLSHWPDLENLQAERCKFLNKVTGFTQIRAFERIFSEPGFSEKCEFSFCDCDKLINFAEMPKIVSALAHSPLHITARPLLLPVKMYMYMAHNNPKMMARYHDANNTSPPHDLIGWSDNSHRYSWLSFSEAKMYEFYDRISQINEKICTRDMSNIEKIYSVYDWITHNISYDFETLRAERKGYPTKFATLYEKWGLNKLNKSRAIQGVTRGLRGAYDFVAKSIKYDPIKKMEDKKALEDLHKSCQMRTAYYALFNKKAVCAGLSNVFGAMLAAEGISVNNCFCQTKNIDDDLDVVNHQISSCDLEMRENDGVSTKFYRYYFDPTWDLGKDSKENFALTPDEASQNYRLDFDDLAYASGVSAKDSLDFIAQQVKEKQAAAEAQSLAVPALQKENTSAQNHESMER